MVVVVVVVVVFVGCWLLVVAVKYVQHANFSFNMMIRRLAEFEVALIMSGS